MLANDATREMYIAFTRGPLRSMRSTYTHSRESQGGVYDPVTETRTGGSGGFSSTLNGILRSVESKIVDGVTITNDMSKLTVLQMETDDVPEENDSVSSGDVDYRTVKVLQDPAKVFYHLILTGAS